MQYTNYKIGAYFFRIITELINNCELLQNYNTFEPSTMYVNFFHVNIQELINSKQNFYQRLKTSKVHAYFNVVNNMLSVY